MTETVKAYYQDATGTVSEALLPAIEATSGVRRHPHQWSFRSDPASFAPVPEGAELSSGPAGGLNRLRGASINFDHPAGVTR